MDPAIFTLRERVLALERHTGLKPDLDAVPGGYVFGCDQSKPGSDRTMQFACTPLNAPLPDMTRMEQYLLQQRNIELDAELGATRTDLAHARGRVDLLEARARARTPHALEAENERLAAQLRGARGECSRLAQEGDKVRGLLLDETKRVADLLEGKDHAERRAAVEVERVKELLRDLRGIQAHVNKVLGL